MSAEVLAYAFAFGFAFTVALVIFVYYRAVALLQFFQQEEYDNDRFIKWVFRKRAFDKKATFITLSAFIAWFFLRDQGPIYDFAFYVIVLIALLIGAFFSFPTKTTVKKPLVMTSRVQRILFVYLVLIAIYFASALQLVDKNDTTGFMLAFIAFYQWPPFFLVAANFILKPVEELINRKFLKQAYKRLENITPTIIAIAGSYGKTSIKNILAHILSAEAPTLATPGSVNTLMGVCRIVREDLREQHKFFVVEMGAYGPGSIKKLCDLTPPNLGIISGVGMAHYERFRSLETVFETKFELADSLVGRERPVIIYADGVPEVFLIPYFSKNPRILLCGTKNAIPKPNVFIQSVSQTKDGLKITLDYKVGGKDKSANLEVPLFGLHQATNVALAVSAALKLKFPMDTIKAALKTIPQIPNRLEVVQSKGGPTIINDAYNSNPKGFANALEVLSLLKKPQGRRILVTPGIVELGDEHEAQHRLLGQKAGKIVDLALVIGAKRMDSFIDGFKASKLQGTTLKIFEAQKEAEDWVQHNVGPSDTILFENNLPDLYETKIRF